MLNISEPLVSVNWLNEHINKPNLIVIDATMKKITWEKNEYENQDIQIKNARFLDIKNVFSDTTASFPNTMLSAQEFQEQARLLGINKDSTIIVYDDIGIYTSPRVWWMFKSMGHDNIAVLDGGLPIWVKAGYTTEKPKKFIGKKGNFIANFNQNFFKNYTNVLQAINIGTEILDARSIDRFDGSKPEPREGLRSGHIPTSKNIHYNDLLNGTLLKPVDDLKKIFASKLKKEDDIIFSCGSGITACILALGATVSGYKKLSVYDGSWTEWGSLSELPIEK
ncbi:sulfurtransferase [Urechidicola croceus]|uniref:Rhodanese domain-containing protein n=1 Tax=Urechidicola croceus TaxID=1850246 RepID=A0A1D8P4G4_9FLAO|nr:sulfurtransferase [Urechidicola croceus]AOW19462.1 hypothetical protein LPB138_01625 [Urechidicola croceus]